MFIVIMYIFRFIFAHDLFIDYRANWIELGLRGGCLGSDCCGMPAFRAYKYTPYCVKTIHINML